MNIKMMSKIMFVLMFSFVFCYSSIAITPGPQPNQTGDLAVIIAASDTTEYINDWITTSHETPVIIKRIKETKQGATVYIAFLITGFSSDDNNNYNFIVNFMLYGPDGEIIFNEKNYAKSLGKTPKNPTFIMADPALDLILEDSDPVGVYKLEAEVIDLIVNKNAKNIYFLELIKE
ncbi:MAG: hypothetical protein KAJ14_06230 [Candidatus Omnitrophica bacterium]|nr:hypothetical protein [Candidatus Omnitrophota bacterium]MCK5492687.1 hypothetical protein [Candidatus Omnitrophota bacterium]